MVGINHFGFDGLLPVVMVISLIVGNDDGMNRVFKRDSEGKHFLLGCAIFFQACVIAFSQPMPRWPR